jgi:uncharacterized membrane protein YjfL (UPF0719 family)
MDEAHAIDHWPVNSGRSSNPTVARFTNLVNRSDSMNESIGSYVFWAAVAGAVYMAIFRTKDFMALNGHMKENMRWSNQGVAKAGLGLFKMFKK